MTYRPLLASVFALGLAACTASAEDPESTSSTTDSLSSDANRELAAARRGTAAFHDVNAGLAAGYRFNPQCVASPAGGMGHHFVNPSLLGPGLDPGKPEVLLYAPGDDGLELVGVEYLSPIIIDGKPYTGATRPTAEQAPAPSLFGTTFVGPIPPRGPLPWHYALHVWLWKHNPTGMFSDWNPAVSCN